MNTFYEATQNADFEHIREKVIMNRHPEAKTFDLALGQEYFQENCQSIIDGSIIKKVLGRPITLEDILNLLSNKPCEYKGFIEIFELCKVANTNSYSIDMFDKHDVRYELCLWLISKTLHEQTSETWQLIANFS